MSSQRPRPPAPAEVGGAAIRFLAEHGFEATTAGDLADAVGMSRSTFFRRFGSKDDVIFADHDLALARIEEFLGETELPIPEALARSIVDVLHLLTRDPEAAQLRSDLLRRTRPCGSASSSSPTATSGSAPRISPGWPNRGRRTGFPSRSPRRWSPCTTPRCAAG